MSEQRPRRNIPFGRPWITSADRQAVADVLDGHLLTHGPRCQAFERAMARFLGHDAHCVTVSSGMAALHLAYLEFGIGPGDEVIVPAMTHIATVHAVQWVGATPVFVDCEADTGNVSAARIAAAVGPRTKGISVVHFQGIPCQMPKIMAIAHRHGLKVIEDCALAIGARIAGRHVGLFGDAACFSFYPVKHITSGEGGMFATRHPDVALRVAKRRAFGVDRQHDQRKLPGMYDVDMLGLNYRMSEMHAALGCSQLERVDEILTRRAENFQRLRDRLSRLPHVRVLDATDEQSRNAHYALSLVLRGPLAAHRDQIVRTLRAAGIGTSVYYPQPVPRMSFYRDLYGYQQQRYPTATEISDHSIALPVGPHVSTEDVDYMIAHVTDALASVNARPGQAA